MDSPGAVIAGLNDEQRRAVEAVTGPVCILAGAGSGKTTTITRRIANQVASGAFRPEEILAVTFTDKAAGEMRRRLHSLGAQGVRARTFHSAALAQLTGLSQRGPEQILPSKGLALRQLANRLPKPYRFRPAADLANEVEWAKNRRITPERYEASLGSHEPPIPVDLMTRIFKEYELGKRTKNLVDFEDLLELTIQMFDRDEDAAERFRARYRAFTVDEYQDVNLLQQSLLERWLGGRDDLCVVGDDYQSIYSFTGASPRYLIEIPRRYPGARVIRLEHNYRSTPEVLELANRLAPHLGGTDKQLRAVAGSGPDAVVKWRASPEAEASFIVEQIHKLAGEGVAFEEMAILYRTNFRSEDYEEALSGAGIPYQVRDGAFLRRAASRRMLSILKRHRGTDIAEAVRKTAIRDGWQESPPDDLGDQELTRQNDLSRLIALADAFDDGVHTGPDLAVDLESRFGNEGEGRGVNLLTYHRAKGTEYDAVFLPRLIEGELPFKRAKSEEAIAEERRLLYVGITRARRHIFLTWPGDSKLKPSPFLVDLGVTGRPRPSAPKASDGPQVSALKRWRLERAQRDEVPAYVILHDRTLEEISNRRPGSVEELAAIPGIGPSKIERYADEILDVVAGLNR